VFHGLGPVESDECIAVRSSGVSRVGDWEAEADLPGRASAGSGSAETGAGACPDTGTGRPGARPGPVTASAAATAQAPDLAAAIEAWRVWRVVHKDGGYRLCSALKPTVWPRREPLDAECLHPEPPLRWLRRRERHGAPDASCECGIYGAGLEQIGLYLMPAPAEPALARVVGRVSLWGTVIECERGFRASNAYPLSIYVPVDAHGEGGDGCDELADSLERYGVPVRLLPARASQAPAELAKLVAAAG
jgi:hypothetical protein